MRSKMEWRNSVYNSKFTNTREISNTIVIKGNIKEITATKPYATQKQNKTMQI